MSFAMTHVHVVLCVAAKASVIFTRGDLFFIGHSQAKTEEEEVSSQDPHQYENVDHRRRADSGLVNPGREAETKRNPLSV